MCLTKPSLILRTTIGLLTLLIWLVASFSRPPVACAQAPVTFGPTRLVNQYPDAVTFEVTVTTSQNPITSARLTYQLRNERFFTTLELPVEPGDVIELQHTWDIAGLDIPPFAPIEFTWQVTDAAGNLYRSNGEVVLPDPHYSWQALHTPAFYLWWHDQPEGFGGELQAAVQASIQRNQELFGVELDHPVQVVVYNGQAEFTAWQRAIQPNLIGRAYTRLGVTIQFLHEGMARREWLADVIPHEITHLYIEQTAYNPLIDLPIWLTEGIAQYQEEDNPAEVAQAARNLARQGQLVPLSELDHHIRQADSTAVNQAYLQANSITLYLVDRYGPSCLTALLQANREGRSNEEAFQLVFGRSTTEIEQDWLAWLDVSPGLLITPGVNDYITPLPPHRPPPKGELGIENTYAILIALATLSAPGCGVMMLGAIGITLWFILRNRRKQPFP